MHKNTTVTVDLGNNETATLIVEDVNYLDADGKETFLSVPTEGGSAYTFVGDEKLSVVDVHEGVYTIPASRFDALDKKFATLAKKAAKVGCEAPSYTVVGAYFVDHRDAEEIEAGLPKRLEKISLITVDGGVVKYNGWRLLGVIESDSEALRGTYMVNVVPGETIPPKFRNRDEIDPLYCDHCRSRRRRTATFIVAHDDGEVKQVGRQCIRDFLGHSSPERLASYMQYLLELDGDLQDDDEFSSGCRVEYTYSIIEFLTIVRTVMREAGWMSRGAARNSYDGRQATADIAWSIITPAYSPKDREDKVKWMAKVTDADREFAQAALAFAPSLWEGKEDVSDYIFNMQGALSNNIIGHKTTGLVASLLSCYAKHLEMEIVKKARENDANEHIGSVGERITFKATITMVKYFENEWGTKTMIKFLTSEGNTLVWWYSGDDDYEQGESYKVTGTVKKHDEYRGTNTTTVARCACSPVDVTYVKLTKKQAELVATRVEATWGYGETRPETMWMTDNLLCIPTSAVASALELVEWLSNQGRVGKGAVKKIEKEWDAEELGQLAA